MGFMIKQQFEENTVKLNYVEIMNIVILQTFLDVHFKEKQKQRQSYFLVPVLGSKHFTCNPSTKGHGCPKDFFPL